MELSPQIQAPTDLPPGEKVPDNSSGDISLPNNSFDSEMLSNVYLKITNPAICYRKLRTFSADHSASFDKKI